MTSSIAKRPWYQFSLRTMFVLVFVVSIPLAWVGYSLDWIKQRHEAIASHLVYQPYMFSLKYLYQDRPMAPGWLWIFGEEGYDDLWSDASPNDINRAARLFPEATIHIQ
jgi:hypothetical protein